MKNRIDILGTGLVRYLGKLFMMDLGISRFTWLLGVRFSRPVASRAE